MHTIHDIAFEVTVDTMNQRISWEQYYADFLKNKLLPQVETICDNWSKKHPNIKCSIDSIDVNVEVDGLNLEELQKKIIQQINRQFISIQSNGSSTDGKINAVFTRETSTFDALLRYLSSGVLPSNIPVKTFKEWLGKLTEFNSTEKAKLNTLFAASTDTIQRMLSLLRTNYEAFLTLIDAKQHITAQYVTLEISFFKQFLKAIFDGFQLKYSDEIANIWYKTLGTTSSLAQFSKTFLQLLQPKIASEGKRLTAENAQAVIIVLLQAIIHYKNGKAITISVSKIGKIVNDTNSSTEKNTKDSTASNKASETKILDVEKAIEKEATQKEQTNSTTKNNDAEALQVDKKVIDLNKNEVTKAATEIDQTQAKTTNEVKNKTANGTESHLAEANIPKGISNEIAFTTEKAGLILVHPFLNTFFKGANVISAENELLAESKACLLLHYLATETETVTDVELTLEKILLGIPLETIIHCEITLTDEDKALCDELLRAVLSHWVVLKKSTVNTLRDMFLKRDGFVTITEESIKLKIERLAQDILLEKIPWNIRLFRFKWMEKIVHVEW